jgi:dipeptidyl aminopeptidase/acylaminoacyl peptidase
MSRRAVVCRVKVWVTSAGPKLKRGSVGLGLCLLLTAACPSNRAQTGKRQMSVDDQFRLVEPGAPLLSPDGRWVLYAVGRTSIAENKRYSSVWLAPADGRVPPREFLREGDSSPMWAPSSRSVYFLRAVLSGEQRSRELFEQGVEDSVARQHSRIGPGPGGSWQLSRDGSFFLVLRQEAEPSGPAADSDVVFVDEGSNGQTRDYWRNLWRYDLGTETLKRVSNRDWWINSADLSPDGRSAVVAGRPDNGRNTGWKAELFLVDLATGSSRQITHNVAPESGPLWSPDGRSILFSAVRLDRWELGNGDLWLLDVGSGRARNLTPNHTGRFAQPVFSPDGKSIFAQSGYGTTRFPVRIDVASGRITRLVQTDGVVRVGSWSDDRRTYAYIYTDFNTPQEIYVGQTGAAADRQRRITDLNPWVREEIALGSVQAVKWKSFDGKEIEGLLHLPPPETTGRGPRPMIMIVHVACGPGCSWLNVFYPKNHVYAGLGYAQLSPNVRGASNYDDAFMRANMFDIGGGDRLDLMSGVDAMIARSIADPNRLGISGWSYGGALGGYTITQTNRFKAASLGAMVSDWVTDYGSVVYYSTERWFLGGNPWTRPAHWRGRSSLTHANRVRTPTLLHHGDEDDACSPYQSMNFFVALRRFGTTARLIRYPGEPHDLQQPRHIRIRDSQDVAWMQWFIRGIKDPSALGGSPWEAF